MKRLPVVDPQTRTPGGDPLTEVRAEQARRWRGGERPPAEEFLARYPELADDTEAAQVVIYGEALLREELDGTPPNPIEYTTRFPAHAAALALQFELHGPLSKSKVTPVLPGFEIVRELGRGGMGVVYLARETSLSRFVAVKMLLSGEFATASARMRFRSEAESAARLKHPHIVEIHTFGEHAGRPYLVMEFVTGGNLTQHLDGTPLDPRLAAEILKPLADAIQHAHAAGVVHRDLKPANILLASRGREQSVVGPIPVAHAPGSPKVTDFGLAKRLDVGEGPTVTSQILGTPSYMAPEQAAGAKDVGPAADIYALGAILYECLTGRPPFKAATPLETLKHIAEREPASPRSLNPSVPRDLETVCLKCLAKVPAQRYTSASALSEDIGRFLTGRPVLARPIGILGRSWRLAKRKPALVGISATLVIVVLLALAGTTALYLQADRLHQEAESRDREGLRLRGRNAFEMSQSAMALTDARHYERAVLAHRACIEEFVRLVEIDYLTTANRYLHAQHLDQLAYTYLQINRPREALQCADEAVIAFDALKAEHPDSATARRMSLRTRHNRAAALRQLGRIPEAASQLDRLIGDYTKTFGPCIAADDKDRDSVCSLYYDRAMARHRLERFTDAVADYDEALRRDGGRRWAELTACRANSLARCGRVVEAMEQCRPLLAIPHLEANLVLEAAVVHSIASQSSRLSLVEREAASASTIELLSRILRIDPNQKRSLSADPAFAHLRVRTDYQALFAGK